MTGLTDRVALVTGAARGVGSTIAQTLADAGAEVILSDVLVAEGEEAAAEIGGSASFAKLDVTQETDWENVVAATLKRVGRIDILVNNAGGAPPAESATVSPRFNEKIIELNLLAPLMFSQAVHDTMQTQTDGGVIINIASVSGQRANPKGVAYGAAKAGLINMTQTLAHEWGPKIRVLAPVVGMIVTDDAHLFYGDQDGIDAIGAILPMKRMGEPADVADVVLFCVSPLARWMTGCTVPIDGGGEGPAYLDAATREAPST